MTQNVGQGDAAWLGEMRRANYFLTFLMRGAMRSLEPGMSISCLDVPRHAYPERRNCRLGLFIEASQQQSRDMK